MELEEILDKRDLSYKEAAEILEVSQKIANLKKREFELEDRIGELESRRAEVEEQIEWKEKALAGLKTEMAEKLESISTDLGNSIGGAISIIIVDKEIRKLVNRMCSWGFRPEHMEYLQKKVTEKIRRSEEFLLKQATEMEGA